MNSAWFDRRGSGQTCEQRWDGNVYTFDNLQVALYELDADGDAEVAALKYGDVRVPLDCSGTWNCEGNSGWMRERSVTPSNSKVSGHGRRRRAGIRREGLYRQDSRKRHTNSGGTKNTRIVAKRPVFLWIHRWRLLAPVCGRTGVQPKEGEPPMAKHDRRKTSGQPPSSRPVTIQVPLPVLGVVNDLDRAPAVAAAERRARPAARWRRRRGRRRVRAHRRARRPAGRRAGAPHRHAPSARLLGRCQLRSDAVDGARPGRLGGAPLRWRRAKGRRGPLGRPTGSGSPATSSPTTTGSTCRSVTDC